MKKLVAIVLTMCMVLVLFAGCSDSSSDNSSNVVNGNASSVNGDNNTSDNNDSDNVAPDVNAYGKATIEETVIYDDHDVKITAYELSETEDAFNLSFKMINNSDRKTRFLVTDFFINGFKTTGKYKTFMADPGTEATTDIVFEKSQLELDGKKYWGTNSIVTIEGIEARLSIDGEGYVIPFTLYTSAYNGSEPTFDMSGEKIYEKDGATIIFKEIVKVDNKNAAVMMVVNSGDEAFRVHTNEGYINGTYTAFPFADLVRADSVVCKTVITDSNCEISDVESIKFKLAFMGKSGGIYDEVDFDIAVNK